MTTATTSKTANELAPHSDQALQLATEVAEASVMLDLFEVLGVRSINLTITDLAGIKVGFKRYKSLTSFRAALPALLRVSQTHHLNIIVRPIAPRAVSLIQLDDLTASQVDRVRAMSFLVLETSPGNFQAWLAAEDADSDTARRIKKSAGADPNASGATRLAGSYNFKSKYAPSYPRVLLHAVTPERTVTVVELQRAGLIAPEESRHYAACYAPASQSKHSFLQWPSYSRCLADAPFAKNHDGKDRSAADFEFCLISIDRGWSIEATASQLMTESQKAKSVGYNYALVTAKRAASVVSTNRR